MNDKAMVFQLFKENKTGEVEKVYGKDGWTSADNKCCSVFSEMLSTAAFAMTGISPKSTLEKMKCLFCLHRVYFNPEPVEEDNLFTHGLSKLGRCMQFLPPSLDLYAHPITKSNDTLFSCDNVQVIRFRHPMLSCILQSPQDPSNKDFPPCKLISRQLPESDVEDPNSTAGSPTASVPARDDGILLLRPQQVTLGGIKDHSFGDPRVMGDPSTDNDIGIVDSGCSRSMTGNKEKLDDFVQIKGGIVKFGGGDGRISGKGTIRTSKLDFENVYYVEELQHFNLFSVSQICDKKNKVLFTDTDCLVLSEEFQLPDENQVVLRIPREHDLYTFRISDLQPEQKVTCLVAKASLDESTRWHRRMAHVNFKTINKLAKEGLVDGLPLKVFTNEHNCVACNKGKQHKASYKHISAVRFITDTLQLLHMDLFGPTKGFEEEVYVTQPKGFEDPYFPKHVYRVVKA
ncbi:putative ribonuclease H-like domain-containing protein, partial [Tanacetum coccineum]